MMKKKLFDMFAELFGDSEGARFYFSPGRVNLIGEHTDYNGGHVFPASITYGPQGVAAPRDDNKILVYSTNFDDIGVISFTLDELEYDKKANWANYVKGMVLKLNEAGHSIDHGFELLVEGTIPNGAGLSSSASLELLVGVVLEDLFDLKTDRLELVQTGKKVENEFIGVNSGIMDQFAIAMGKKENAIFLDTATLEYEYAPIHLENAKIVIACSNKKRGLGDSKYNERRSECETALAELQQVVKIKTLGDLDEETFEKFKAIIKSDVRRKRAKHAVYENQRTIRAVEALKNNDVKLFGELMNASHVSLRDDYEVTGIELDTLVEEAWKVDGVIGSRMTGAGFGGCTVSIVKDEAIDTFIEQVGKAYKEKIGYAADFYVVEIGDGPQTL